MFCSLDCSYIDAASNDTEVKQEWAADDFGGKGTLLFQHSFYAGKNCCSTYVYDNIQKIKNTPNAGMKPS